MFRGSCKAGPAAAVVDGSQSAQQALFFCFSITTALVPALRRAPTVRTWVVIDLSGTCPPPPQVRRHADESEWSCRCLKVDEGHGVGHRRVQLDGDVELGLCGKLIWLTADAAGALVLRWLPAPCRLYWPPPTARTTRSAAFGTKTTLGCRLKTPKQQRIKPTPLVETKVTKYFWLSCAAPRLQAEEAEHRLPRALPERVRDFRGRLRA